MFVVSLSHYYAQLALRCILEWFASLATELNKLRQFIANTQRDMADPLCSHTSMTQQAMMAGLLCYLDVSREGRRLVILCLCSCVRDSTRSSTK